MSWRPFDYVASRVREVCIGSDATYPCSACKGTGRVNKSKLIDRVIQLVPCPRCVGTGRLAR